MPKRYEEAFKRIAVEHLRDINQFGVTEVNGDSITNVRDLCEILDVSSYSLYKWDKEIPEIETLADIGEPLEYEADAEGFDIDRDTEFDSELPDLEVEPYEAETTIYTETWQVIADKILKEMFGKRFYSWLGRVYGVRDYGNLDLRHTQLQVGLKLIELSGLVDMEKIKEGFKL